MGLSSFIYRKILNKINLSKEDLSSLKKNLTTKNICAGPFVKEGKMCPVTTAASIKLKVERFKDKEIVRKSLLKLGVSNSYLKFYYVVFDIPAMFSKNFFRNRLKEFRKMTDDLMKKS